MNRIAIIPARGGSRRIPGKNIREFHGKPILAYSIETARKSGLFNAGVWVSTDSPEIACVAEAYGAGVHRRDPALASSDVGTQEVMAAALVDLQSDTPARIDAACCIYATAPLMCAADLRRGLGMLAAGLTPYVYSVGPDSKDAGQFYWGLKESFITGMPLDGNSQHVVLSATRCCDINVEEDFLRAERMYAELHGECGRYRVIRNEPRGSGLPHRTLAAGLTLAAAREEEKRLQAGRHEPADHPDRAREAGPTRPGAGRSQTRQESGHMSATEQFWAGEFGDAYSKRSPGDVAANTVLFSRILRRAPGVSSAIEFGANVGANLDAIRRILPQANLAGVEINAGAAKLLRDVANEVYERSMLEHSGMRQWDLSFTKGVLIHIPPEDLPRAYDALWLASRRYVLVAEYYNPTPVGIEYRGHSDRLWKRDFAGELCDRFSDLQVIDYGFVWRRDVFAQDDLTWFLLEKR